MKCANPKCCRDAQHLSDGSLLLLEMDLPPEERLAGDEFGFPVCAAPSKYFWLCEACSRNLRIVGWTVAGPVLAPRLMFRPQLRRSTARSMSLYKAPFD